MNEGCSWFTTDCIDTTTDLSNYDQYFCHGSDDDGCNHDYKAPADCSFTTGLSIPAQFQWFDNPTAGGIDDESDYCPWRRLTGFGGLPSDYYSICYDLRGADADNGNFGKRWDYGMKYTFYFVSDFVLPVNTFIYN